MPRFLPALLLVLTVVLVALGLQWASDAPPAPTPAPQQPAEPPSAGAPPPTAAATDAGSSRVAVEPTVAEPTQPPIPTDAVWLDVRVVDAASKAALANALVRWTNGSEHPRIEALPARERPRYYGHQDLVAERFGWSTRSNANGIAHIAASKAGASVFATIDGRYGTALVGGNQEPPAGGWQIAIETDLTLRVQVLDGDGRPAADVEVGIRMFEASGKERPNRGQLQSELTAAPDGFAEFRHLQRWLRDRFDADAAQLEYRVALRVPGHDDPGVRFDVTAPPATPVVVQLPPTGSLRARLLHRGQPMIEQTWFKVWRGAEDDYEASNRARQLPVDADGCAHFAHVALGGELTVSGSTFGGELNGTVSAPTRAGQQVSIDLDADSIYSLEGRVVDGDGRSLANATLRGEYHTDVMSGSGARIQTDAEGRFLMLLTKGFKDKARLDRLVLTWSADKVTLRAEAASRELTRGPNDLGVLPLTRGAPVVAGRFVGEAANGQWPWTVIEVLSPRRARDGKERWGPDRTISIDLQPDGSFEARGETLATRYRLRFQSPFHLPIEPIEFRVGTTGLEVPIELGGRLRATALLPAGGNSSTLAAVLSSSAVPPELDPFGRPTNRYTAQTRTTEPGTWELQWQGLPKATYALEFHLDGFATPLFTVPDVVVPPPEGGDTRLQGIDLREVVRLVRFVPRGGAAADGDLLGFVEPAPEDPAREWSGFAISTEGSMLMPKAPCDLLIVAGSRQPQHVTCSGDEVRLTLQEWPTVDLTITNLPTLPEGCTLTLDHVRPRTGKDQRYRTRYRGGTLESWLAPEAANAPVVDGHARLTLGEGPARLYGVLKLGKEQQVLQQWTPAEIQGGANQPPVQVMLSPEELQQALEKLQHSGK